MRVLLVDNYDSFTYNVSDLLARLGAEVEVVRNDALGVPELLERRDDAIVLSPGPGRPETAGVSIALVRAAIEHDVPLLGICLGMQSIAAALGGRVERLPRVVHGAASEIEHDGVGIHAGMPAGFLAGRYHSLVVDEASLPAELVATSRSGDVLMGLRHATAPLVGMQYHPESILTPHGGTLLANFLRVASDERRLDFHPRALDRVA